MEEGNISDSKTLFGLYSVGLGRAMDPESLRCRNVFKHSSPHADTPHSGQDEMPPSAKASAPEGTEKGVPVRS